MALKIDNIDEVKSEIKNIDDKKKELEAVLNKLNTEINGLKNYWQSGTSEVVFEGYEEFRAYFEGVIKFFDNDVKYLNGVLEGIEEFESAANATMEDKLAA